MRNKLMVVMLLAILFSVAITSRMNVSAKTETNDTDDNIAFVFIGDSRTVGLDNTVNFQEEDNMFMVAECGQGLKWFKKDGLKQLKQIRKNNKKFDKWIYIFNLGVNDLDNAEKYVEILDELSKEATVYYISVNPTVDAKTRGVKCSNIEEFNKVIETNYDNYIDSYSYLKDIGYTADDGLHYDNETYNNIYEYVLLSIELNELMKEHNLSPNEVVNLYHV